MSIDRLPKVLAVDDDPNWLSQIPLILEEEAQVTCVERLAQALLLIEADYFDVVLLDLNFENEEMTGLSLFRKIHLLDADVDVIVVSGESNPSKLVQVFNEGVSRFIPKPATPEQIRIEVGKVLASRTVRKRSEAKDPSETPFVGISDSIRNLNHQINELERAPFRDILIQGETGTGKEILARYLAERFGKGRKFVPMHCGAIADGLIESELFGHTKGAFTGAETQRAGVFESAAGGFVFLDEIGEMPVHQQAKMLRVLQERKVQRVGTHDEISVNFRSISATHVNLPEAVRTKLFREDLFFRLSQFVLKIPPLRDRREDIPMIVEKILVSLPQGRKRALTDEALELLMAYDWPGNVRQLKAFIENLLYRSKSDVIRPSDVARILPEVASVVPGFQPGLRTALPGGRYARSVLNGEKKKFELAIAQAGSRDAAAVLLGMSRATFFRKAKELGLVRDKRNS